MKRLLIAMMIAAAFCSGLFGHTLMSAHAEEKESAQLSRYFTSIQIRQGDSLWDIAGKYAPETGYSVQEYMEELKRMNGLRDEKIHSGEYLTVLYCAE